MKKVGAYLLAGTAFITCPCHLVFSLPLVLGLLSGTALGATLAAHTGLIVAADIAYFFVALIGGGYLFSQLLTDAENGRRKRKFAPRNRVAFGSRGPKARKRSGP